MSNGTLSPLLSAALVLLGASLAACGSDGEPAVDTPDAAGPEAFDLGFARGPTDRRVRAVRVDEGGDGTDDSSIVYAYDEAGRIASETRERGGATSQVIVYQYEDGRLVTRSDGIDTITYVHDESGRVVAIEDEEGDRSTFTYAEGRLASFSEPDFPDDDDDFGPLPDGEVAPEAPAPPIVTTSVIYDGVLVDRLERLDGAGVLRLRHDDRALLVSIEDIDERQARASIQTFERDERGRVVVIETVDSESGAVFDAEEVPDSFETVSRTIRLGYADDRLVSSVTRDDRRFTPAETRVAFEYSANGLLERVLVSALDEADDVDERLVRVLRYEYESPGCAEQASEDPRVTLLIERAGIGGPSIAATQCGYWADPF